MAPRRRFEFSCPEFPVTIDWLQAMAQTWDREPKCKVCHRYYKIGDIVKWMRPAEDGTEHGHKRCVVRLKEREEAMKKETPTRKKR